MTTQKEKPDEHNLLKMIDEMRAVTKKYGIPKGFLFVPDRLEISIKRNKYDSFNLSYKEYFDYLPNIVAQIAITTAINLSVQIGIPKEQIKRIEKNGVGIELDGNADRIMKLVMIELFIQKRFSMQEMETFFSATKNSIKSLTALSDLQFEWNEETSKKYFDKMEELSRIQQKNPNIKSELEAIPKKYAKTIEKVWSKLEKKDQTNEPQ